MKTTLISILATFFLFNGFNASAQDAFISSKLEKVWSSSEGFNIPESSHYNSADKLIYVSNVVGKPSAKDGAGYISTLNLKGEMIEKEWFVGLNAPKGIACTKTKLYVTDIDRVVEIDLKTAKIVKSYKNSKSRSLNDVAVASNGRVYVSDSNGNCIFYVGNDSLEVFLESNQLAKMNGIIANADLLYLGSNDNFISINQKTKVIKVLAEKVGYLDGIERIAPNLFVASDWKGTVKLIEVGKGVEKLLDTSALKINAADLGYIPTLKLFLVPTFSDNKINAYKLKR